MSKNFSFSTRGPDIVSVELAKVLSQKGSWAFKPLFDIVHLSLRAKGCAGGGEEMLRLRAHEKLQKFLSAGIVTKNGKEYTGVPDALVNFFKATEELNAKVKAAVQNRAALTSSAPTASPTGAVTKAATKAVSKKSLPPKGKAPRAKRITAR